MTDCIEHDPEKWVPVFGKAQTASQSENTDSTQYDFALALIAGMQGRRRALGR
jgi:hypothetical protein